MTVPDVASKMERARTHYIRQLDTYRARLLPCLEDVRSGTLSADRLEYIHTLAHKLAGSSGTYGYSRLEHAARTLEAKSDPGLLVLSRPDLAASIAMLMDALEQAPVSPPDPEARRPEAPETGADPAKGRLDTAARAKLLVVDDDPMLGGLLKSLFEPEIGVKLLLNGDGLCGEVKACEPDLILLDDNLPGARGVELVSELAANPECASVPVIMLTANTDGRDVLRAITAGAIDYFTKPFEPASFVAHIRRLLL